MLFLHVVLVTSLLLTNVAQCGTPLAEEASRGKRRVTSSLQDQRRLSLNGNSVSREAFVSGEEEDSDVELIDVVNETWRGKLPEDQNCSSSWADTEFVDVSAEFPDVGCVYSSIPVTLDDKLELQYTSDKNSGYIQTPNFDSTTRYKSNMNTWVGVAVPAGHVVFVSMNFLDVSCEDSVSLYKGGNSTSGGTIVWQKCHVFLPRPVLLDTSEFHVHFRSSKYTVRGKGFRLLFTFHKRSEALRKLERGKWNCSVTHWADFKQHFPCNLRQDCVNGEDEAECPYSQKCGLGRVWTINRCYIYVIPDKQPLTWGEAATLCLLQDKNAQLASLTTYREMRDVRRALANRTMDRVFVGLTSASAWDMPLIYRDMWIWADGTVAYSLDLIAAPSRKPHCALTRKTKPSLMQTNGLELSACGVEHTAHVLCELTDSHTAERENSDRTVPTISSLENASFTEQFVQCPDLHWSHALLACDVDSSCWSRGGGGGSCLAPLDPLPPSLTCGSGNQDVPYTLVCDHRADCTDESDEDFCDFPACSHATEISCGNDQCVLATAWCDGAVDCVNSADERQCLPAERSLDIVTALPPITIDFNKMGNFTVDGFEVFGNSLTCSETHFACVVEDYCLPVYVRCNGVYDCPGKEDEAECDSYTCPGFYRCRASRVCVHADHLCDGVFQCPQRDDELLCGFSCPPGCTCYGTAFFCTRVTTLGSYTQLRFLDASGTGLTLGDVVNNAMLIHLSLAQCNLTRVDRVSLPNLRSLDLSDNTLTTVNFSDFQLLPNLQTLSLSGNPLSTFSHSTELPMSSLILFDMSRVILRELLTDFFSVFPNLRTMNLSNSAVDRVVGDGFGFMKELLVLDLRGCPMTVFPRGLLEGSGKLERVYSDSFKLCCPGTLPVGFNPSHCHAPSDEISSCEALLRSDAYRLFLSFVCVLALCGNLGSLLYRALSEVRSKLGYSTFVTHLCVSDFMMGVYLAVIGVADRLYMGDYLWNDVMWKGSVFCKAAGFLALVSCEVSAFIITLITLDRILVIRFPFSELHFRKFSANLTCAVVWVVCGILAAVPLFPVTSHWEFYSQTGICLPLPVTRNDFPGHSYSFSIMIILNFVLFVVIATGQVFVYWSVRANVMAASDTTRQSQDLTIARRLITVAASDFLCWFPIGLLGMLAVEGMPIPGEVNVAIAIFVLPLNSALNPFLYNLNMVLERRRKTREERLRKVLLGLLEAKMVEKEEENEKSYTKEEACALLKDWLFQGVLSEERVHSYFQDAPTNELVM